MTLRQSRKWTCQNLKSISKKMGKSRSRVDWSLIWWSFSYFTIILIKTFEQPTKWYITMTQLKFRNMRNSGCNSPNLVHNSMGTWVNFLWPRRTSRVSGIINHLDITLNHCYHVVLRWSIHHSNLHASIQYGLARSCPYHFILTFSCMWKQGML